MYPHQLPAMDSARISVLLEPFLDAALSPAQLDQVSTYIDLLLRWNARINLTAIRDPEQIVPRHFGESLFLARHLFPIPAKHAPSTPFAPSVKGGNTVTQSTPETTPARVIDLGSGAGFPALPIKIWAPEIHLTLIESNHKKAAFLREVVRSLTLTNVDVIPQRAETVLSRLARSHPEPAPPHTDLPSPCPSDRREESALAPPQRCVLPPADVVTFRAVEKFHKTLPLAASFLAPHGRLALLVSSAPQSSLRAIPSLQWRAVHIPQSHSRLLAIGEHRAKWNGSR